MGRQKSQKVESGGQQEEAVGQEGNRPNFITGKTETDAMTSSHGISFRKKT